MKFLRIGSAFVSLEKLVTIIKSYDKGRFYIVAGFGGDTTSDFFVEFDTKELRDNEFTRVAALLDATS